MKSRDRIKISFSEIKDILGCETFEFPKYTTQIMNLANQNAQGTRPSVVGQMSELIQEFSGTGVEEWETWYRQTHPDAISNATQKIYEMVKKLRSSILLIDEEMVARWVEDLVLVKTYIGLRFQEAILEKVAQIKQTTYQLALPEDESQGIDGYIGDTPVSIKPYTYKVKNALPEKIDVPIIFYDKGKNGIEIDIHGLE